MNTKFLKQAAKFGITPEEIFEGERGEPEFFASALTKLVNATTTSIKDFVTGFVKYDITPVTHRMYSVSEAEIILLDGTTKKVTGCCFVGTKFKDGTVIDEEKAQYVSTARAFRAVLRAVSFDPMKALEQGEVTLSPRSAEAYRKSIHAVKKQKNMKDKDYRNFLLSAVGKDSTKGMTEGELAQAAGLFQAMVR